MKPEDRPEGDQFEIHRALVTAGAIRQEMEEIIKTLSSPPSAVDRLAAHADPKIAERVAESDAATLRMRVLSDLVEAQMDIAGQLLDRRADDAFKAIGDRASRS